MDWNPRLALVWQIVEDVLSLENLSTNPYLISRLLPPSFVPLSILPTLQPLLKIKATESEIIQCCTYSHNFELVDLGDLKVISPHFLIVPMILIVKRVAPIGTLSDFGRFLGSLIGQVRFWAYPTNDGSDFAVGFQCTDQCIAAWRAMRVLPFHGQRLEIEVYTLGQSYWGYRMQQATGPTIGVRSEARGSPKHEHRLGGRSTT
jgi:hypothetical protein